MYGFDILLFLFGTSLFFHVQFELLLPHLHIGFSRGSRSIHIAANGIISFFLMAELYSTVYMYHIFFIHSSVNGHLGCQGEGWGKG